MTVRKIKGEWYVDTYVRRLPPCSVSDARWVPGAEWGHVLMRRRTPIGDVRPDTVPHGRWVAIVERGSAHAWSAYRLDGQRLNDEPLTRRQAMAAVEREWLRVHKILMTASVA